MKIAVIGSRSLEISDLKKYLPCECTEIVSGGAKWVDSSAAAYARENGIRLTVFLPEYAKYGRGAPIVRNKQIVDYADEVLAFWNGSSRGTLSVVRYCERSAKPCTVIVIK